MFYKLSISNIKKSFKDYTIYFVTLMLGVCIFYIFNSVDSQAAVKDMSKSQQNMLELVADVISYTSVFVAVVLGFLVIYASNFFIKKRNKEFGIYMTLGMSKRNLSTILLLETLFIGLLSLVVGLLVGVPLSQVTSVFVTKLFDAKMSQFKFNFSTKAMTNTIIYFGIIYIVVMIFNTIIVNKNKLIDLLQKEKKQEKIKIRNSFITTLFFIISIVMLGVTYYFWLTKRDDLLDAEKGKNMLPMTLIFLVVGTVLFFYSLAGFIIKTLSKCHNMYCNKLNTFVFKQLSGKINTMVVTMSIICIMLLGVLCLLPASFAYKQDADNTPKKLGDADFQLRHYANDKNGTSLINYDEYLDKNEILKNNIKDKIVFNTYSDKKLNMGVVLGKYKSRINTNWLNYALTDDKIVKIMSESDYNKIANVYKLDRVNLQDNECVIVANNPQFLDCYKEMLKEDISYNIFDKNLKVNKEVTNGFVEFMSVNGSQEYGFVVVKDDVIRTDNEYIQDQFLIGTYNTKDEDKIYDMEEEIRNKTLKEREANEERSDKEPIAFMTTKRNIKEGTSSQALVITFFSIYLGFIFLISSAAILALKALSDSMDDKDKYKTIRRIGADEKDISKAVFKQTFIFFMLPLFLASIHAIFTLKCCNSILSLKGVTGVLNGIVVTYVSLVAVYGVYFIITYICSKSIIRKDTV